MSPRPADPQMRAALIDAATRMIAEEGGQPLTLRRLVDEVGTSTMAVYTHFGGMEEVRREVRRVGYARLAERLAAVRPSSDPVADLVLHGRAYVLAAQADLNLYRVMFTAEPLDPVDAVVGQEAFGMLVAAIDRCIVAERFDRADPSFLALQLWAVTHGLVMLQISGHLDPVAVQDCLDETAGNLYRAYGDDPRDVARSFGSARRRASRLGWKAVGR